MAKLTKKQKRINDKVIPNTLYIATDAIERSDPFLCKDYVTDLFQRLYHAEVSNNEYCDCAHRKISRILYFCCRLQATRSPT